MVALLRVEDMHAASDSTRLVAYVAGSMRHEVERLIRTAERLAEYSSRAIPSDVASDYARLQDDIAELELAFSDLRALLRHESRPPA